MIDTLSGNDKSGRVVVLDPTEYVELNVWTPVPTVREDALNIQKLVPSVIYNWYLQLVLIGRAAKLIASPNSMLDTLFIVLELNVILVNPLSFPVPPLNVIPPVCEVSELLYINTPPIDVFGTGGEKPHELQFSVVTFVDTVPENPSWYTWPW